MPAASCKVCKSLSIALIALFTSAGRAVRVDSRAFLQNSNINMYSGNLARILVWRLHFLFLWNKNARKSHAVQQTLNVRNVLSEVFVDPIETASGNVASMRKPLDGSLWWYWIAANAAKKNGASFKNYHRLSHLFCLYGVQIRQSLLCNMRDWSQG